MDTQTLKARVDTFLNDFLTKHSPQWVVWLVVHAELVKQIPTYKALFQVIIPGPDLEAVQSFSPP